MQLLAYVGVAKLVDAVDLKSASSDTVPVRFRSPTNLLFSIAISIVIAIHKLIVFCDLLY
jgi:hypothetical protein